VPLNLKGLKETRSVNEVATDPPTKTANFGAPPNSERVIVLMLGTLNSAYRITLIRASRGPLAAMELAGEGLR
jgi:hypothetical protein